MKIYNKVVINMTTNEVIEEDSFDYNGEIAKCDAVLTPAVLVPAIMGALGIGGGLYQAEQQRSAQQDAEDAAEEAQQRSIKQQKDWQAQQVKLWRENAFPSAEKIAQQRKEGMAKLGSARTTAYDDAARNLSVRGMYPGSPYMGKASGDIEKGYLSGLASLENKLVESRNTPSFALPFAGYAPTYNTGSSGSGSSSGTNPLGMAMGMLMASAMGDNSTGSNPLTAATSVPYTADLSSMFNGISFYNPTL